MALAADYGKFPVAERAMVNSRMVNGAGFYYLPAAKNAIFRVFTPKSRFQKVR
jgi:hypothetical protein